MTRFEKLTKWIGTPTSLLIHTVFFIGCLLSRFFGFSAEDIMLFLTTIVSLEAIYLSIFIQMSINNHAQKLETMSDNVAELQETVEEVSDDVEELQETVEEVQETVEEEVQETESA